MTRIIQPFALLHFALLVAVALVFSSCLKDDDDDTVYPSDAAIISFSLGDFNRYLTTTSSTGTDSTYKVSVTGSTYKFYIDQVNRQIYNADSLPYGTDAAHLLCTVTSRNSGTVVIKNVDSDTLKYYNSTDSVDFSTPRQFSVFSLDGTEQVDYTVTVNVHQEQADSFRWSRASTTEAFAQARALRMLYYKDRMYVMASDGQVSSICHTSMDGTEEWTMATPNFNTPIPSSATDNFVATDEAMYLYMDRTILKSTDANEWTAIAQTELNRLVAADAQSLYAIGTDGQLLSSADEGQTWTVETLDSDPSLMPTDHLSFCRLPSRVNTSTESIVLAGSRSVEAYPADAHAMVWSKVAEHEAGSRQDPWMYLSNNDVAAYSLPRMSALTLTPYNGGILAMGGAGLGASTAEAYSCLYYSMDGGIYWAKSSDVPLPDGFSATGAFAMATDGKQCLWMVCGGSGQVWRGRMPGADWVKNQTSFTE